MNRVKPRARPLRPSLLAVAAAAVVLALTGCSRKSADAGDPKAPALAALQSRCKLEWGMAPGAKPTQIDQQCRCVADAAARAISAPDLQHYLKEKSFPAEAEKAMRTIRTDCGRQSGLV